MERGFHPREQGDLGEIQAMAWLASVGARVWVPLNHSPDADVIAELGEGDPLRIQVKTSGYCKGDRFSVSLCTNGGNRSWGGAVNLFDRARCEFLFVWLTDGRRWFIPSSAVDGRRGINLGGKKYSEYAIRRDGEIPEAAACCLQCPSPTRGSAVVGETGRSVKSVASPERVRLPPPPSSPAAAGVRRSRSARATISSGHQVTIPIGPFRSAGLNPGDRFEVTAIDEGAVLIERVHAAPHPPQQSLDLDVVA